MFATALIREPRARYQVRALDGDRQLATRNRLPFDSAQGKPATLDSLPLTEAALVRLWAGQRFPASALATRQGVPLRVLHPGRRGRGAGPDFRDALIATPSGRLLRGDVELHVRASDFRAHGHHRDPRYDGVVLHVVFEDDTAEDTALACGRRAPVVPLARWTRRRAEELAAWLAGPRLWREPCHDALARLGEEHVLEILEELGERRFRERGAALGAEIGARGSGEALYRTLLAGLAYGGDRQRLLAVAEALPWRGLAARLEVAPAEERAVLAEALLLSAAGLLPAESDDAPRDPHEVRWRALLRQHGVAPHPSAGVFAPATRPANHPARRLAGMARLLVRHGARAEGLGMPGAPLKEPARLVAAWTVAAEGYWRRNLAPGLPARRAPGALIGQSRAVELLVNAVLPWAAALAEAEGEAGRAAGVRAIFARLPRPARYGTLAFLEANLGGGGRPLALDARRQQGLLALYKTDCTQGGCGRCELS